MDQPKPVERLIDDRMPGVALGSHAGDRKPGKTSSTAAITRKRSVEQAESKQEQCFTSGTVPVVAVQRSVKLNPKAPLSQTLVGSMDSKGAPRPISESVAHADTPVIMWWYAGSADRPQIVVKLELGTLVELLAS